MIDLESWLPIKWRYERNKQNLIMALTLLPILLIDAMVLYLLEKIIYPDFLIILLLVISNFFVYLKLKPRVKKLLEIKNKV